MPREVFVTGASGYIGRSLIQKLTARGHAVRALVRRGSEGKLPPGPLPGLGNALDAASYRAAGPPAATRPRPPPPPAAPLRPRLGKPHPSPAKARQFREVDLVSIREAVAAAL